MCKHAIDLYDLVVKMCGFKIIKMVYGHVQCKHCQNYLKIVNFQDIDALLFTSS